MVQIYTLRTHSIVQTLHFNSRVLSVRASCRLLIVALDAQVRRRLQFCSASSHDLVALDTCNMP